MDRYGEPPSRSDLAAPGREVPGAGPAGRARGGDDRGQATCASPGGRCPSRRRTAAAALPRQHREGHLAYDPGAAALDRSGRRAADPRRAHCWPGCARSSTRWSTGRPCRSQGETKETSRRGAVAQHVDQRPGPRRRSGGPAAARALSSCSGTAPGGPPRSTGQRGRRPAGRRLRRQVLAGSAASRARSRASRRGPLGSRRCRSCCRTSWPKSTPTSTRCSRRSRSPPSSMAWAGTRHPRRRPRGQLRRGGRGLRPGPTAIVDLGAADRCRRPGHRPVSSPTTRRSPRAELLAQHAAEADIEIDPRFGEIVDGTLQPGNGSHSDPVSHLAGSPAPRRTPARSW